MPLRASQQTLAMIARHLKVPEASMAAPGPVHSRFPTVLTPGPIAETMPSMTTFIAGTVRDADATNLTCGRRSASCRVDDAVVRDKA